jgi:hypothetical protein
VVVGEAGSGKTFATVAAAEAWAGSGVAVRVAAPTWRAANVLRSEGLDATSVARFLADLDREEAVGRAALVRGSVMLVDEAGMVDSASLARLIDHVREADAKLVLIGDPAQLGEIEAGGLFGSIARRTDSVVLDDVIRHEYDLDREGAKRIREGRGAEAIEVYRSEDRVVVSVDPDARREEMVRDWWRSYSEGEDALMIAKRNAEVARLNALAREVMKAEGRLGDGEIRVGDAGFAAGDQVITRVNDHRARIYNRERWRQVGGPRGRARGAGRHRLREAVECRRRLPGAGESQRRIAGPPARLCRHHLPGAGRHRRPRVRHGRPLVDRQEMYVAASRSRGETLFYATPEVDLEREEFAPHTPGREGLAHIAAAAERDGAQISAHDEALRTRLDGLSSLELARLRCELGSEAGAERQDDRRREQLDERIARSEELIAGVESERRALGDRHDGAGMRSAPTRGPSPARRPRGEVTEGARATPRRARGTAGRRA